MIIEDQDLEVLNILYRGSSLSAYEITKRIFPKLNSNGLTAKKKNFIYRLREMVKMNLIIEKEKSGTNYYSLVKKNVEFAEDSQASSKSPKRTIDLGKGYWIKINSEVWEIVNFKE